MESSFYQNVFLLTQAVPPSKDFLEYFKEGMFDKPNTIGFLHVSHYLLTIYDADRFKKLLQWPVFCKKTEAKYRTDVKDFLTAVANENRDVDFPQILASHLLHAGGRKFSSIMWKLSTVTLRTYIRRESNFELNLLAPKSGLAEDLSRMILNHAIQQSTKNIEDFDTVVSKKEQDGELFAKEMADSIQRNQENLFLTRHSLMKLAEEAPVHPDMKRRLADPNDSEVIQMWKHSFDKNLQYVKSKQQRLKEITDISNNVACMVASIASTDSNVLDGGRLPHIGIDSVSEIEGLSAETQVILHRLYADGNLVLENFLLLFSSVLLNFRRYLDKHGYPDLSGCDSQVQASCEDMKSMSDLFRALHDRIANISSSVHNDRNRYHCTNSRNYLSSQYMDNDLLDSVVLKSSPTIRINGNLDPETTDVNERLELTPVEITNNKGLFSRYKRDKDNTPHALTKLRPKLLVSRINFDDTRSSVISERMSPANRGLHSKMTNLSSTNLSGKYSRLFTSYQRKTSSAFNSSIMSVPGSSRLNSISDMNATCDVYNISELRPHVTTKSKFDNRAMYTPPKRNTSRASSTINDEHKSISTTEVSRIVINEMTELTVETGQSPKIRKSEKSDRNRRISISDLVERYRKLHEKSSDVTAHFENSSVASDESEKQ